MDVWHCGFTQEDELGVQENMQGRAEKKERAKVLQGR